MDLSQCLAKIEQAGFRIAIEGDSLTVAPASNLTDSQRRWIRDHKPAILDHLRQPGRLIDADGGHDLPASNDMAKPIMVEVWTPAGAPVRVKARDQAHANFIKAMNPAPGMVRCCDCQHADVQAGIASCRAGVESGLPIQGFWATDRHLCVEFQGKPAKSGSAQNSDPIPEKSTSPEPHRATKSS